MPNKRRVWLLVSVALAAAVIVPATMASGSAGAWDFAPPSSSPTATTVLGTPAVGLAVDVTTDTVVTALGIDATLGAAAVLTVEVRTVADNVPGAVVASASASVAGGDGGFHDVTLAEPFTFVAGQRYDIRFAAAGGWGATGNVLQLYSWDNHLFDPAVAFTVGPFVVLDGGGGSFGYSYGYTRTPHVHAVGVATDATAPTVDVRVAGGATEAASGWYNVDSSGTDGVIVEVSATDDSPITHLACTDNGHVVLDQSSGAPATLTLTDGVHSVACAATDTYGNVGETGSALVLRIDQTPPTLAPRVTPNPVDQGQGAAADAHASDRFGVARESCDAPSTVALGHHEVRCVAEDVPGNSASAVAAYDVVAAFDGFYDPVDAGGTNRAKAGSSVPLKFSVGGDHGLDILATGSPSVRACGAATSTAASGKLSYDADTDTYTYVWKTDKMWAASCREVTVQLTGGSAKTARFTFA